MGAQGPGWAVPRPAGGSEAPGLRGAGRGGPRSQTTSGAGPSVPEQRTGWGEVRRAGPGLERPRAGGRRDLRAPHPIPTPPPGPARTHARTHARPLGAPGARPGGCWLGGGGVRGRGGVGRPESGRGWCGSSTARAPVERCGWPARPAGQSEREAQRRALRAPGGSRLRLRPYHPERARSRLISEAKQGRAWLVLGWETAWEYRVL